MDIKDELIRIETLCNLGLDHILPKEECLTRIRERVMVVLNPKEETKEFKPKINKEQQKAVRGG